MFTPLATGDTESQFYKYQQTLTTCKGIHPARSTLMNLGLLFPASNQMSLLGYPVRSSNLNSNVFFLSICSSFIFPTSVNSTPNFQVAQVKLGSHPYCYAFLSQHISSLTRHLYLHSISRNELFCSVSFLPISSLLLWSHLHRSSPALSD